MTSSSVSIFNALRMLNPTVVCSFIFSNSSSVSLPAFLKISSGTPIFPMSCRRPPRSNRTQAL